MHKEYDVVSVVVRRELRDPSTRSLIRKQFLSVNISTVNLTSTLLIFLP